ncbi:SHOCT domain-containing protein [Clostridium sp.]|uniref:SHOCT domain-containing protein n=1 Tax=Clostridium sp. TaxID=1506 RepID=UPI0034642C28
MAAASAKKKGVYVIAIEFRDGKRSLLEVDEKIYRKMLLLNFRNNNEANEEGLSSYNQENILEQIKKLSELKDSGILTEEEFNNKKSELLTRI